MSEISFERYGRLAMLDLSYTEMSERGLSTIAAQKKALVDIMAKLDLQPEDQCLEIGCGVGNMLIPLSYFVGHMSGIDHENCLEIVKKRCSADNITLIPGNFLALDPGKETFDKILVYSVLQYLSREQLFSFVDKALGLLRTGGKMLLGDLPNNSLRERFLASPSGKKFEEEWRKKYAANRHSDIYIKAAQQAEPDPENVAFDDALVLELVAYLRDSGVHASILPQPRDLPFGNSREDILVTRPA